MNKILLIILILQFLIISPRSVSAQSTQLRLGVMSDSTSDEYRANDNRAGGTQYAATTLAWTELIHIYRAYDLGVWGTRSEPRRTGYEYNWARSGAIASTLVSSGQHTGLASQVSQGLVDVVYFQIGNNDFAYYAEGAAIYNGTISGTALNSKISSLLSNIQFALDTILAANPNIKVLVGTIPDPGNTPHWRSQFPDNTKRLRVTNAITMANTGIKAMATSRPRVRIFDQEIFAQNLLGRVNASGNLIVGDQAITLLTNSNEPHHLTLGDNIHGGTVIEGLFANEVITHLNQLLARSIPTFTDAEILLNAGISTSLPLPTATPVPSSKIGDGNNDGKVNGIDYTLWVTRYNTNAFGPSNGDFNSDGRVNGIDYTLWATNYGK